MALKLSKIQHIGIPVTNIVQSEAFYTRLGFSKVMASTFQHKGEEGQVAMMQSGDIVMELYQMPDSELAEIRSRSNGHIDHIAFDVEDIDAVFAELKAQSFSIVEDAPVYLPFWAKGCKYFYIIGPDGERLEFNQIL